MAVLCFVAGCFQHGGREMKHQRGFTLMEMLVVVAIILIIAAITIPSMTQAKVHADEASAVASIRAINQAEVSYMAAYGGYAQSLANLGGAEPCTKSEATACILDQSLAAGEKSGYNFVAVGSNPANAMDQSYSVGAAPMVFDRTGKRLFCSSDKGVIRVDANTTGSTIPPDAEQCAGFKALR
jgi:type IV pilus assembly protein PilA